ncbi:ABC transporter ATP-binding protein [Tenacibaculum piscium]|uniref:ABC transporter ATP-binding protein n=1 Tax=Tenacibaculum piscium TaxID=1458515 RepID=UPI00187B72A0|nr:ABC transporter ATP-binding protein [Tenacibaculum piscium]MBE7685176.1 ATP-binding cassette domain-containing protein [Tenacibaculum piscium]
MNTELLSVKKVGKIFDNGKVIALKNVSFSLKKGKIVAIVGESGSGKTTLIRLITGLETVSEGTILLKEKVVSSISEFVVPQRRNVGMVFQDYALFPHFSVADNIAYGLSKLSAQVKKERIKEVLKLVGLSEKENSYPHELSGGQQQRVALARALAPKPELLILDEPFSNLDVILRNQLRKDILAILKQTNTTAIFVTHDIKDAMAISDEIIVLKNGVILQQGNTKEVSENPKEGYVKLLFESV